MRTLALAVLAAATLAGCGSAGTTPTTGTHAHTPAAPASTAAPAAATAVSTPGLIQCTFKVTTNKGESLIERYSGYGIRWYQTSEDYPQDCSGILQSLQGGTTTVTQLSQKPAGVALCYKNGWYVWPVGGPALAKQLCSDFEGHA